MSLTARRGYRRPYAPWAIFVHAIGTSLKRRCQYNAASLANSNFLILIEYCSPVQNVLRVCHRAQVLMYHVCARPFLAHALMEHHASNLSLRERHYFTSAFSCIWYLPLSPQLSKYTPMHATATLEYISAYVHAKKLRDRIKGPRTYS